MTREYDLQLRQAIERLLGYAPDHIKHDGFTRFSTNGRASNADGWVCVGKTGNVYFGCWRQGVEGSWRPHEMAHQLPCPVRRPNPLDASAIVRRRAKASSDIAAVWRHARRIEPTSAAGRYLAKRGLPLDYYPAALRSTFLPYYLNGAACGKYHVMVAAVTDESGELIALHRTYLSIGGDKANVPHPKKLTQTAAPLAGASIKLFPPNTVENMVTLGVAEGIETALAAWLGSGIPTWSCISANGMRTFQWPCHLRRLVIFADHDLNGVGQAAARELAARAAASGLEVRVLVPAAPGSDWLDVLTGDVA